MPIIPTKDYEANFLAFPKKSTDALSKKNEDIPCKKRTCAVSIMLFPMPSPQSLSRLTS